MAPADAASAMRVPDTAASQPQMTLPSARLACMATRLMDTARARPPAGGALGRGGPVLCVPADRLGITLTQAAPAAQVPTTAIAVVPVEAMSSVAAIPRQKAKVHTAFSDRP